MMLPMRIDLNRTSSIFLCLALTRFHLRVGTRLALKSLAPVLAVFFGSFYLLRPEFFYTLIGSLVSSGPLALGIFFGSAGLATAGIAAPKVHFGLTGWIRHLPASSTAHRRLAASAIMIAMIPVLIALLVITSVFVLSTGIPMIHFSLGLPLLAAASAESVLPVKRRNLARAGSLAACFLSMSGRTWGWLSAFVLVCLVDLVSGPLVQTRKRIPVRRSVRGGAFHLILALRALRFRTGFFLMVSLVPQALHAVFVLNNNPDPAILSKTARAAGGMSFVLLSALAANSLASRRPPWPWSRALPRSARQRVLSDAVFIGLLNLLPFIPMAFKSYSISFPLLFSIPSLALFSSLMIRAHAHSPMGPAGRILIVGFTGSLAVCLYPFTCLLFAGLGLPILKKAVEEERSRKVSRWLEVHHLAAGDSLSWSRQ